VLGNWVATIGWNIAQALNDNWSEILSAQDGKIFDAPIVLNNVNSEWLTDGKLRLVEEVSTSLSQGLIDPLNAP
jgi:hypothetical protein